VGNRTQRTEDGQTTPYGYAPDSNRLTTIDGQSVPYDATGNILTLAGDTFTYGARNRRQTTERNGTLIAEYEYNALGQRTHKSHAGTETHFVHGRNGQLIGEAIREYVYLESEPLAMIHQGAVYYFHNDQLGSPLKLTDSNQNVAWGGVRAPFGEMTVSTNAVENPLRFPGQYFDEETGLHYNYFRDYDPVIGRYVQSDPYGLILQGSDSLKSHSEVVPSNFVSRITGLNHLYGYARQNPGKFTDPYGLRPTKNPRGSDGKLITHGCRKTCIVNFAGTSILAAGAGFGFGAIAGKGAAGALVGHFGSNVNSGYGYYSLGACLRQCKEEKDSEICN